MNNFNRSNDLAHPNAPANPGTQSPHHLLSHHQAQLDESGVNDDVRDARGYRSFEDAAEVRSEKFADYQCRIPALFFPSYDVNGRASNSHIRPDEPRLDARSGKPIKYEFAPGSRQSIDVNPLLKDEIGDPSVPLYIAEGIKKADSAISQGLLCIALTGVWNWRGTNAFGGKVALPDWESIALNGRRVYVVFDSDVTTNRHVLAALQRLVGFLKKRGAKVQVILLPGGSNGQKVGLDDFFVAGHTVDELHSYATSKIPTLQSSGSPKRGGAPISGEGMADEDSAPAANPYRSTPQGMAYHKPTRDGSTAVWLSNFTAKILTEVVESDGIDLQRYYQIQAICKGRHSTFRVATVGFAGMNWVNEFLGAEAIVFPGVGIKDHLRVAIQMLSGSPAKEFIITHTGWVRLEDGRWVFCHNAGAIGLEVSEDA